MIFNFIENLFVCLVFDDRSIVNLCLLLDFDISRCILFLADVINDISFVNFRLNVPILKLDYVFFQVLVKVMAPYYKIVE